MNRLYSTDEAVIQHYAFLYDYYGDTPALCRALDNLKISFQDTAKQAAWEGIFKGIKSQANGKYAESLANFEEAGRFIRENTPLHLFFHRQKLFSYVISAKKDIKEVQSLYNYLIDQYKDNPDPIIHWQAVSAMLDESYAAWMISGKTGLQEVDDEIIKLYENSQDNNIRIIVAKTMINKANDLHYSGFDKEAVSLINEIEEKYHNSNEPRLIKQIVLALNYKAFISFEFSNLEEAFRQYRKTIDTYSRKKGAYIFEDLLLKAKSMQVFILADLNKKNKALALFDKLYNDHKNTNNLNVQNDLILVVLAEADLLKEAGKFDRQIRIADKTLKQFQKSDLESIQLRLLELMLVKAATLYRQGKWNKEIDVYNGIINRFKNNAVLPSFKEQIFRAMKYRVNLLDRMGYLDEAIRTNRENIDFVKKSDTFDDFNLIYLWAKQAELLIKEDMYDEYLIIYNEAFEKYINSADTAIRNIIVRLIFNRAYYEGKRQKQDEKKRLLRQIIGLFKDDADIDTAEVVTNAMLHLGETLQKEKAWDEAIQVFLGTKKYSNHDNDYIQFQIACSLENRIKCLEAKKSETGEIRAACNEFIEMFKPSGIEEIKKMVSAVESQYLRENE